MTPLTWNPLSVMMVVSIAALVLLPMACLSQTLTTTEASVAASSTAPSLPSQMATGEALLIDQDPPGDSIGNLIASDDGMYVFIIEPDCNAAVVKVDNNVTLWTMVPPGSMAGSRPCQVRLNASALVMTDRDGNPIWTSKSFAQGPAPYSLKMQNDGNLVLYAGDNKALWQTDTYGRPAVLAQNETLGANAWLWSPSRQYKFIMQDDCNAVLYKAGVGKALWSTNDGGKKDMAPCSFSLDMNGTLAVQGKPLPVTMKEATVWSNIARAGSQGTYTLELQDDGNLVEYGGANRTVIFATNTKQP
ncbi:unnamed protein product (mitochondrion) [Plasmodiophora brassicae]|uniref:Bulb-type lectin domain-containing protein n=1 Tax=Plasmodiophora brassicae TaxID=37360 RepID=A0A0G4IKC0_PLABS|nr:hypothetical protein PBRA_004414 [Plasmodiophora brassicae]SPQ99952.1 unnamed protein product [Plasmodiophora brassicae]